MLMGKDEPDSGTVKVGETVNMIGVGQDRMEELDPTKTVFEEITGGQDELELGTSTMNSRAYLSWFGFKGAQQQQIVGNLSGGERNRVQLAKLLKSGANLIILDEPTVSPNAALAGALFKLRHVSSSPAEPFSFAERLGCGNTAITGRGSVGLCWQCHCSVTRSLLSGSRGDAYTCLRRRFRVVLLPRELCGLRREQEGASR